MTKNIGKTDRILRLVLSLLLFLFAWWEGSWIVFGAALFVLYEAVASWCLFYQLTGKNSCPIEKDK